MGCQGKPTRTVTRTKTISKSTNNPVNIASYQVPQLYAEELTSALNRLMAAKPIKEYLSKGEENVEKVVHVVKETGRAKLVPGGRILVKAPNSFHEGIDQFIKQFLKNAPPFPQSFRTKVWVVASIKNNKIAFKGLWPPELQSFKNKLQKEKNTRCSVILDQVEFTTMSSRRFNIGGGFLKLSGSQALINDDIIMNLNLRMRANSIKTRVKLKKDEMFSLGSSNINRGGIAKYVHSKCLETSKDVKEKEKKEKRNNYQNINLLYLITSTIE